MIYVYVLLGVSAFALVAYTFFVLLMLSAMTDGLCAALNDVSETGVPND